MAEAILYQMKATDENHGKIFQGLKDDLEIDMNDYDEVARINLKEFKKVFKSDIQGMLESIFSYGNSTKQFRQNYPNARSISVSDIIEIDGKYYYCDTFGFKEVSDKVKVKQEEAVENYMDKLSTEYMAKIFTQMRQNGWDGKEETADKYFDDIMRKIDPDFDKHNPKEQAQDNSEPLREERYYYSEIVYVEDGLKSIKGSLGNVQMRLAEAMQDSTENEYTKEQFEVLKNADINIGNLIIDVAKVNEKLEKAFPSRIRMMTPEEKEYIEAHRNELENKDESLKLQEIETIGNPEINNDVEEFDLGDNSDPENKFHNEDGSDKTIYDYLEDRIGQDMSVGELNTVLQSLFGKFGKVFLTFDEFYNQDPDERQELVIWEDEDMYTITYEIKDQIEPTVEITDVNVE